MHFTQALSETLTNRLLDELYLLTEIEQERELTAIEKEQYLILVSILNGNNIEIPFGYTV